MALGPFATRRCPPACKAEGWTCRKCLISKSLGFKPFTEEKADENRKDRVEKGIPETSLGPGGKPKRHTVEHPIGSALRTQPKERGKKNRSSIKTNNGKQGHCFFVTTWTTLAYDGLDRVVETTTPDGQKVTVSYSGNYTTVVDQALFQRKTKTDALGRIVQTLEPDPGLNNFGTGSYTTGYAWRWTS